jgi:hypothetical protein
MGAQVRFEQKEKSIAEIAVYRSWFDENIMKSDRRPAQKLCPSYHAAAETPNVGMILMRKWYQPVQSHVTISRLSDHGSSVIILGGQIRVMKCSVRSLFY